MIAYRLKLYPMRERWLLNFRGARRFQTARWLTPLLLVGCNSRTRVTSTCSDMEVSEVAHQTCITSCLSRYWLPIAVQDILKRTASALHQLSTAGTPLQQELLIACWLVLCCCTGSAVQEVSICTVSVSGSCWHTTKHGRFDKFYVPV